MKEKQIRKEISLEKGKNKKTEACKLPHRTLNSHEIICEQIELSTLEPDGSTFTNEATEDYQNSSN